ncbi:MAG: hypothetical protein PVH19_13055 [Planctomycetia bacterium]
MKSTSRILFVAAGLAITLLMVSSVKAEDEPKEDGKAAVDRLRKALAAERTFVIRNRETLDAMVAAAATKRLDAAVLLIDALKYNYEPLCSNEMWSQRTLIPSITRLKVNYGTQVGPLLMFRGVTTTDLIMRERCALAVKNIASKEEIANYKKAFSFDKATNPKAVEFGQLLDKEIFEMKFYSACDERGTTFREMRRRSELCKQQMMRGKEQKENKE